jgi:CelD/BcsL family acetyltransferase involved in cellulose biosynthesis
MNASAISVKFVVGSRQLFSVSRHLVTVSWSLDNLVSAAAPVFGDDNGAHGYRILSAPQSALENVRISKPGHIIGGLQTYNRYYIDMTGSYDDYLARFSSKTRSTFRRKERKLAELSGGAIDIREYRTPDDMDEFLKYAEPLSRITYQAKLLDAGLPTTGEAQAEMMALAAQNRIRAFLLFIEGKAVSYLYLPIENDIISYAFLGYDPAVANLSPGTVLQLYALEKLFAESCYRYFDFTEGEGAHKQMFGTHSIQACSFLLLKPNTAHRLLLGSLNAFDSGIAVASSLAKRTGAGSAIRRMLRG